MPRSLPLPAAQLAMHPTPMPIPPHLWCVHRVAAPGLAPWGSPGFPIPRKVLQLRGRSIHAGEIILHNSSGLGTPWDPPGSSADLKGFSGSYKSQNLISRTWNLSVESYNQPFEFPSAGVMKSGMFTVNSVDITDAARQATNTDVKWDRWDVNDNCVHTGRSVKTV